MYGHVSRIWRWIRHRLVLFLADVLNSLPRPAARICGVWTGLFLWMMNHAERRAAEKRAAGALKLDCAESRRLVRRNVVTLGRYLPDALRLAAMTPDELNRIVRVRGLEHLRDALAKGRGAFILSAHIGNWELLAATLAANGVPLSVIARRPSDPAFAERLHALRTRWGVRSIWREQGMLPVVRALKAGNAVGILMDQSIDVPGVYVPFFRRNAHVAVGPVRLALRLNVPVVPIHMEDDSDGRYVAVVEPPLEMPSPLEKPSPQEARHGADPDALEKTVAGQWTKHIEDWVRSAPHTWVWVHDRWRCDRPRWIRTAVHMTAAVCLLTGVFGCQDLSEEDRAPVDLNAPSQTIAGTRITWSQSGRTSAIIQANTLKRFGRSDQVLLEGGVQVELFEDDGRKAAIVRGERGTINDRERTATVDSVITVRFLGSDEYGASTLTADSAWANDRTKQVIAVGNVSIVSDSGVTMTTQRLVWNGGRRQFNAPGRVRITNGTEVEEGEGLVANADLSEWTMTSVSGWSTRPVDEVRTRATEETASEP